MRSFGVSVLLTLFLAGCSSGTSSGGIGPGGGSGGGSAGLNGVGGSAGLGSSGSWTGGATSFGGSAGGGVGGTGAVSAGGGGNTPNTGVTVSGSVSIVNAPGGSSTSVILADAATFNLDAPLPQAPSGPRVAGVTSSWSIPDVPDGSYYVLVGFENDGLVLDPDPLSPQILQLAVTGSDVAISTSFKLTGAVEVLAPDAGATVSDPITFQWQESTSPDHYEVRVFDVTGFEVWADVSIPPAPGTVSIPYAGPALVGGQLYRWEVTAVGGFSGAPISVSEDLRGTFTYSSAPQALW